MPTHQWIFDEEVTAAFDDMLTRSIPDYAGLREIVTDLAVAACETASTREAEPPIIVDLGTSRGEQLRDLWSSLGTRARYLAFDCSEPMLEACRTNLAALTRAGVAEIHHHDLRGGMPLLENRATVILSILTLQFVPIERRQQLLRDISQALRPGGTLIIVEKILGATADLDDVLVERYHALKRRNGYTDQQITRKAEALQGVLVPVQGRWLEQMLRTAGFNTDIAWARLNFRMWLAQRHA